MLRQRTMDSFEGEFMWLESFGSCFYSRQSNPYMVCLQGNQDKTFPRPYEVSDGQSWHTLQVLMCDVLPSNLWWALKKVWRGQNLKGPCKEPLSASMLNVRQTYPHVPMRNVIHNPNPMLAAATVFREPNEPAVSSKVVRSKQCKYENRESPHKCKDIGLYRSQPHF